MAWAQVRFAGNCRVDAVASSLKAMTVALASAAAAAALLHFFIFYLEAFAWNGPLAARIFGQQSPEEASITSFYAFNQGVYNLALGLIAGLGAVFLIIGGDALYDVGAALIGAGCGAMLLAALALGITSAAHRPAAVKQGAFPLLAVILVVVHLV